MTSFLPPDMQDMVFQWSNSKMTYEEVRDRIMALAVNRASLSKPAPMEVDKVARYYEEEDEKNVEEEWEEMGEKAEVDYVGETCRRCGGAGHYARECPTPKGKGKGKGGKGGGYAGPGVGKSGGKGKGVGKGEKGKGKFGGQCWQCGQMGHRASECFRRSREMEANANRMIDAVQEDCHVGGIWEIAQVTAKSHTKMPEDRKSVV